MRMLGMIALAIGVITAVLDVTRSIADSAMVMTSLGKEWYEFSPSGLNNAQALVQRHIHPYLWDPVIIKILLLPSWVVFAVLAALLLWCGQVREKRWQSRFGDE